MLMQHFYNYYTVQEIQALDISHKHIQLNRE